MVFKSIDLIDSLRILCVDCSRQIEIVLGIGPWLCPQCIYRICHLQFTRRWCPHSIDENICYFIWDLQNNHIVKSEFGVFAIFVQWPFWPRSTSMFVYKLLFVYNMYIIFGLAENRLQFINCKKWSFCSTLARKPADCKNTFPFQFESFCIDFTKSAFFGKKRAKQY